MLKLSKPYRYLVNQVNYEYNPIVLVVGKIRVGKSWFACYTAQVLQPILDGTMWDVDKQLFVDFDKFIETIENAKKKILIFDEAGNSLGSKEWYSKVNRGMNKILQTQGFRSNIIILALPNPRFLTKDHLRMLDMLFVVQKRGYVKARLVRKNLELLFKDNIKLSYPMFITFKPNKLQKLVLQDYDDVLMKLKKSIPQAIRDSKNKKKKTSKRFEPENVEIDVSKIDDTLISENNNNNLLSDQDIQKVIITDI